MITGKINTEAFTPYMLYHGWNGAFFQAWYTLFRMREIQEELRAVKNYELSDRIRSICVDLEDALNYVGIEYTEEPTK